MDEIARLLADQAGVIARAQVLKAGLRPHDIARMIRRREWATVHDGVFVDHTGELTWLQRAWAAVLFSWPSALSHISAMRAVDGPGRRDRDDAVIHVAVDKARNLKAPEGVRIHRMTAFSIRTQWNVGPPRVRYDHAVLDVAADSSSELDTIAVLADACGSRRTTALRLSETARGRVRLRRKVWLLGVLDDVAAGTCSVLEHGYLTRVERAHGLPVGRRQASHRHLDSTVYRDVDYEEVGLVVELDGRLFHESARARDLDMDRDLDAAVDGRETVRASYGQVFERPCATARRVGAILQRRGWKGTIRSCPECGGSSSPGESDQPR